ncbi:hypothetical protein [Porticoccus sp.]
MKRFSLAAALLLLGLLSGCAQVYVPVSQSHPVGTTPAGTSTQPPPPRPVPAPPPVVEEPGGPRIEPSASAPVSGNSAVVNLLEEAWRLNRAREYDRSNAVAERAMRIDHAEPEVYLVMASNYVAMMQLQLAEQLVRQGLPLAGRRPGVKSELETLLAQIKARR